MSFLLRLLVVAVVRSWLQQLKKEDIEEEEDSYSHLKGSKGEGRKGQPGENTKYMLKRL